MIKEDLQDVTHGRGHFVFTSAIFTTAVHYNASAYMKKELFHHFKNLIMCQSRVENGITEGLLKTSTI